MLKVIAVAFFLCCGQLLLKGAVRGADDAASVWQALVQVGRQKVFWLACVSTGCGAVVWVIALRTSKLSVAYPTMVSLSLLMVTLSGVFLFGERSTPVTWLGVILVMIAVWLLAGPASG